MKFGIFAPLVNPFATGDYLKALGTAVEERGFDSIWVAEHVVLFDEYASQYPYASDGKGFIFSDRGEFALKGFEEPVRVYEVRWQASG
ncbi:MAG: LLM class flavin-dependent oxidoreductase [Chloroflexi bacterium]|nr:MAG: LLM class flavin-dependent oxidoreductase [Chloroflexota bacterium]